MLHYFIIFVTYKQQYCKEKVVEKATLNILPEAPACAKVAKLLWKGQETVFQVTSNRFTNTCTALHIMEKMYDNPYTGTGDIILLS